MPLSSTRTRLHCGLPSMRSVYAACLKYSFRLCSQKEGGRPVSYRLLYVCVHGLLMISPLSCAWLFLGLPMTCIPSESSLRVHPLCQQSVPLVCEMSYASHSTCFPCLASLLIICSLFRSHIISLSTYTSCSTDFVPSCA